MVFKIYSAFESVVIPNVTGNRWSYYWLKKEREERKEKKKEKRKKKKEKKKEGNSGNWIP